MGKLIPLLAAGGGTATVSIGGFYLVKNSGIGTEGERNVQTIETSEKSNGETQERTLQNQSISEVLSFKTLAEFRNEKGGDCAKKYFQDLNYGSEGNVIDSGSNAITADDFPTSVTETNNPNSCLVVNWERTDSSDTVDETNKKWTGNFRWLWSFVNGDKGFVMFSTTKLSSTSNQFDLEGGIYFVSKEGNESNKTWKIKKYKEENGTSKNITESNFDKSFPQPADNLDGLDNGHKTNWGFMSEGKELGKLCGKDEDGCPQEPKQEKQPFKGVWEWTPDNNQSGTLDKWSKKLNDNLSSLFGSDGLDMSSHFSSFTGSWHKKTVSSVQ